jgi:muconolactone delta-isomerase
LEFLVDFEVNVPAGTPDAEVKRRDKAEAAAADNLAAHGNLTRVWKTPVSAEHTKVLRLYRADSEAQLDDLLRALPLAEWMNVNVTRLDPYANDPAQHTSFAGSALPILG